MSGKAARSLNMLRTSKRKSSTTGSLKGTRGGRILKRRLATSSPMGQKKKTNVNSSTGVWNEENDEESDEDDLFGSGAFVMAKGNSSVKGKAAAVSRIRRNEEASWAINIREENKEEESRHAKNGRTADEESKPRDDEYQDDWESYEGQEEAEMALAGGGDDVERYGYSKFKSRVEDNAQGTRIDGLRGEAATVDRSQVIIGDKETWKFPTRREIENPHGCEVVPLVRAKWDVGTTIGKFEVSPIAHHRYGDWLDYEERVRHVLNAKPTASQWQKSLFLITNGGEALATIIRSEKMSKAAPEEGFMHFDMLVKSISEHFWQYQNLTLLHEELRFMKQADGESTVAYWERMEKIVHKLGMDPDSVAVRTGFVLGLKEPTIRERAAINQDWNRRRVIAIATHMETSLATRAGVVTSLDSRQMAEVCTVQDGRPERARQFEAQSGNYGQHDNRVGISQPQGRTPTNQNAVVQNAQQPRVGMNRQTNETRGTCSGCGFWKHRTNEVCRAKGMDCKKCGKIGHFARVCRSMKREINELQAPNSPDRKPEAVERLGNVNAIEKVCGVEEFNKKESGDSVFINCEVGGIPLRLMIDSGAQVNTIAEDKLEVFARAQESGAHDIMLLPADGEQAFYAYAASEPLEILTRVVANVVTKDVNRPTVRVVFHIVRGGRRSLLGRFAARELGVLLMGTDICCVEPTEEEEVEQFPKAPGFQAVLTIRDEVKPRQQYGSRIPVAFQKEARERLEKMRKQGIIEPLLGASEWVSGLNLVMKGKDDFRLTLNMKQVNKAIVRPFHAFPTFDQVRVEIKDAEYFAKIDITSAFHHLELAPEQRHLTCFMTPWGLFQFTRLPFGLSSAPEIYQQFMEGILIGLEGTVCFIDDVLVHAKSRESLQRRTEALLNKIKENNLTLNETKCEYDRESVVFMGHTVSSRGISISEDKVRAIREFREPRNTTEVLSFIGMANFLSIFIPHFSDKTEALRKAAKGPNGFVWGEEQSKAFNELKNIIADAAEGHLGNFQSGRTTYLYTDASGVAIGAMLVQCNEANEMVLIACASKALTKTERNYDQACREALAIVWSAEHFRYYLLGCDFSILTDSSGAINMLSGRALEGNKRIVTRAQTWTHRLDVFRCDIKLIRGKDNRADALSRLCNIEEGDEFDPAENPGEIAELHIGQEDVWINEGFLTMREIREATSIDQELTEVRGALGSEVWPTHLAVFGACKDDLYEWNGMLVKQEKIVMPKALREKAMRIAHNGHVGMTIMKRVLRERLWWPAMDRASEQWVQQCEACQRVARTSHELPMLRTVMPSTAWCHLAMDHGGPYHRWGGRHVLVVEDYCSRYVVVAVVRSTDVNTTTEALEGMFELFGYPSTVRSDNGGAFSKGFVDWCTSRDIVAQKSAPWDPQQNGMAEAFMKVVNKALRVAEVEEGNHAAILRLAVQAHNAAPHSVTKAPPEELMFGRKVRRYFPLLPNAHEMKLSMEQARENDAVAKAKQQQHENEKRRAKPSDLNEGDTVICADKGRSNKLDPIFGSKRFRVMDLHNNAVTLADDEEGKVIRRAYRDVKKMVGPGEDAVVPAAAAEKSSRPKRTVKKPERLAGYVTNVE